MKGILIEKGWGYYILLTPDGEYKRMYGRTPGEIGEEVKSEAFRPVWRYAAGMAAMLAALLLLQSVYLPLQRVAGYVTLDINPSVEFAVNSRDLILSGHPFNEEAGDILGRMSYRRQPVDTVLAEFTRQAIELHYLDSGNENQVHITWIPRGRPQSAADEEKLARMKAVQQEILRQEGQKAVVETEILESEIREEAREQGISPAKLKEIKDRQQKAIPQEKAVEDKDKGTKDERPGKGKGIEKPGKGNSLEKPGSPKQNSKGRGMGP